MDPPDRGLQCGWAGCPEEFDNQAEWMEHVSIHVFTLEPYERTPWLGPPELDPDRQHVSAVDGAFYSIPPNTILNVSDTCADDQSDGDDYRASSQSNTLSSPASAPPPRSLEDERISPYPSTTSRLTLIVAATSTNGIGRGGQLPWRLPKEIAYFAKVTSAAPEGKTNTVIMGRKTWESIPHKFEPLRKGANVVISHNKDLDL